MALISFAAAGALRRAALVSSDYSYATFNLSIAAAICMKS
jgi:hypothetical protein